MAKFNDVTVGLENQQGIYDIAPGFGSVHDASLNYCPEDQVDVMIPKMIGIMESLPFEKVGWKPQLVFKADAKVGKNLGELKEWKK
jgi:hypothetical protein